MLLFRERKEGRKGEKKWKGPFYSVVTHRKLGQKGRKVVAPGIDSHFCWEKEFFGEGERFPIIVINRLAT
jgi:hypothetical protein